MKRYVVMLLLGLLLIGIGGGMLLLQIRDEGLDFRHLQDFFTDRVKFYNWGDRRSADYD